MPVTKRSSKIVTYNEQDDDDDDFIPIKKDRTHKPSKAVEKHDEKSEEEEPKKPVTIENDDDDDEENTSTSDVDDQISPKNKRMKHDEEEESLPAIHQDIPITTSENHSTRLSDIPRRHSSLPLGFPTSKINIPSPHVSRVGLSRKSLPIKPLHPNLTSRVVHE